VKIDRPDGSLELMDRHFKFEWSGHLDAGNNFYLYCGWQRGKSSSAVYLRSLKTGQTRELAPPDLNHSSAFSMPFFYGEDVIYLRSNAVWRISADGSNNRRLFPPEGGF
jgi:hypothetical protein